MALLWWSEDTIILLPPYTMFAIKHVFMAAARIYMNPFFCIKMLKNFTTLAFILLNEYIFDPESSLHVRKLKLCLFRYCLFWGAHAVKTLLQVSGGWVLQSEVTRTLSDHTAGRQPGSYWREHDDLVNYKGDITQVNLILQTHRDVVNRRSNPLSNRLLEESGFHTFY